MILPEQPPEEYEKEFSDVEDVDNDDYPKGSVVPINPEITDHKAWGSTLERCKVCGSTEFIRLDGHWICVEDYVEYGTNIQF